MTKLSVGQKLWYVPFRIRPQKDLGREVEVTAVGRKWAQLDGGRMRAEMFTLRIDGEGYGYGLVGRCYLNRESYEEELRTEEAWRQLRDYLYRHSRPSSVTLAQIRQSAALLGMEAA